ncbi:hypothetical protein NL676_021105 [Syzygium grande]|nr:hypothetical protein NL676_021105 [Syzygium grande]
MVPTCPAFGRREVDGRGTWTCMKPGGHLSRPGRGRNWALNERMATEEEATAWAWLVEGRRNHGRGGRRGSKGEGGRFAMRGRGAKLAMKSSVHR